jgi:hypothetical protein
MSRRTRAVLRKSGHKLPPLVAVSLRIEPEIWERAEWAALARGVNRQQWIRDTLANASQGAKPPEPRCFRGVHVAGAELEKWERVAARRGHTVESLIRKVFTAAAAKDAAEKAA